MQTIIDMSTASDHAYFSEVAVKHGHTSGPLFFTDTKANCIWQWTSQGEHPTADQKLAAQRNSPASTSDAYASANQLRLSALLNNVQACSFEAHYLGCMSRRAEDPGWRLRPPWRLQERPG